MTTMHRFVVAALLLLFSTIANATDAALQRLHAFFDSTRQLQADFYQVLTDEKGGAAQESRGVFYLQRPGKFRWNYQSPHLQEIVGDGDKVWFYDVDLEQITVKRFNQALGSTPALLLSGQSDLEQSFSIEGHGVEGGMSWIKLTPKHQEAGFQYVLLGLEGDMISGMELQDLFGQTTRITFTNIKINLELDPALFHLVPPPGVDVFTE